MSAGPSPGAPPGPVLAFSGGIGGAKLALGLSRILAPGALTIVANTGDDFEHLGLSISPDLDTLLYTLAGLSDTARGWGRKDETWTFMAALGSIGGATWFQLGDGDLALHVERTRRLLGGETLSAITDDIRRRLGVAVRLLPMSDDKVRTKLRTDAGWLDFQDYFVQLRCEPAVRDIAFAGAAAARPQEDMLAALRDPALRAIVICPSNPLISIDPILALPGVSEALAASPAPVVAVSPIVDGRAVKGPTVKMMAELGLSPSAGEVARRYAAFLDGYIVDATETAASTPPGLIVKAVPTIMTTLAAREALAHAVLEFADTLRASR